MNNHMSMKHSKSDISYFDDDSPAPALSEPKKYHQNSSCITLSKKKFCYFKVLISLIVFGVLKTQFIVSSEGNAVLDLFHKL